MQREERLERRETPVEVAAGGSTGEAIGGLATAVLAIVGLAHVFSAYLAGVAALVLGAALLMHGAALFGRFFNLVNQASGNRPWRVELGGGTSAEFLAGSAGIVLGILALLGIVPDVLLAVAVIVFGAGLMLGSGTSARLNALEAERCYADNEGARRMAGELAAATSGAQVLVGLAAVILGIIGLAGVHTLVLALVAFLILGVSVALNGSAVGGKMMTLIQR